MLLLIIFAFIIFALEIYDALEIFVIRLYPYSVTMELVGTYMITFCGLRVRYELYMLV